MREVRVWTTCAVVALLMATLSWLPVRAADKIVTPIAKITTEYTGKFVTVQGVVVGERRFKSGMRYVVADDTGKITLVLFDRELQQVAQPDQLTEGATLNITGKVDFYQQEVQIVPVRGTDVVVVAPAPPIAHIAIGALGQADLGKTVAVRGVVVGASNFSAGFKLTLNDGSGQIAVTLFENTYDGLAKPEHVNVGATLTVTGKVNAFAGELEIVPSAGHKVRVAAPPDREVPLYALGAIGGNDHGAVVRVEGEVARMTAFAHGTDLLLKDETGAQTVRAYRVVMKRVKVNVGDRLIVVGRVHASKAKGVTIEVAMPGDMRVKK